MSSHKLFTYTGYGKLLLSKLKYASIIMLKYAGKSEGINVKCEGQRQDVSLRETSIWSSWLILLSGRAHFQQFVLYFP